MLLSQGAEAVIFLRDNVIVKKRLKKDYRIPEIDLELRRFRTKREARLLRKAPVRVPRVLHCNNKDEIVMEYVEGVRLRDVLDDNPALAEEVGMIVAKLHEANIIHGDLTTSNFILKGDELVVIDFGLAFTSHRIEDMAVDIHLFRQALESKHYRVFDEAYDFFLKGYSFSKREEVLSRLLVVEERGRYKGK